MPELVTYDRSPTSSAPSPWTTARSTSSPSRCCSALHEAFDQAERDGTVVLLTGRPGYFSAGFDLGVLRRPARGHRAHAEARRHPGRAHPRPSPPRSRSPARDMHSRPAPSSSWRRTRGSAPTGPSSSASTRSGSVSRCPWFAIVLARHRLTPAHFDHATVTGTMFDPVGARDAGLLDAVVASRRAGRGARSAAEDLASVDRARARRHQAPGARRASSTELRASIDERARLTRWRRPGTHTGHLDPSGP